MIDYEYTMSRLRNISSDEVAPIIIGSNSSVHRNTRIRPGLVIGVNCEINDGCILESSVGCNVHLHENCVIQPKVKLGFSRAFYVTNKKIQPKNIIVGNKSVIKKNAAIYPDTTLMDSTIIEPYAEIGMLPTSSDEKSRLHTELSGSCVIGRGALIYASVQLGPRLNIEPFTIIPPELAMTFASISDETISPDTVIKKLPQGALKRAYRSIVEKRQVDPKLNR
jgi:UDP-3-O-[3-hydroxymyristoyl] glucosamine N-acyltransferase